MTIELRLLTKENVEDLYPRLRNEDKEETILLGSNPREALIMGYFDNVFLSSRGRAYAIVNTEREEIVGAIGFSSGGHLWALSTKFTVGDLKELFKRTPEIVTRLTHEALKRGALTRDNPTFTNLIHSKNRVSIKWLDRCDLFVVDREWPVAVDGEIFYNFRSKQSYEFYQSEAEVCASPSL